LSNTPRTPAISRNEIRAVYAQGEDAVIALVEGLLARISVLEERVEKLENQQSKHSGNSSKPPSSDGFKPKPKSLRSKSERRSGGQEGHPGQTLEWSEEVEQVERHPVKTCTQCGTSLTSVAVAEWEVRQVRDLAPIQVIVTEHQAEVKCCPCCQTINRGEFPQDVNTIVQYGANLKGLMLYLLDYQLLPSARVQELLSDVLGCEISEGTLYTSRQRCFAELASVEVAIQQQVAQAEVLHCDETGLRVNGKLWWLHVASTDSLTFYFVHTKRGKAAMDAMGILPEYDGIIVHDGLKSYEQYDCDHALCNAHHLRELAFITERYQQAWAEEMFILLCDLKQQVDDAKALSETALSEELMRWFVDRYQTLIVAGLAANPAPDPPPPDAVKSRGRPKQSLAKNLLDRLQHHQAQVLAFMTDFRVPFDNNQAERDLRMMKLKQKISGGFRSVEGAQMFGRIRGYISTLKKQGLNVLEALKQVFLGNPTMPTILQPE